MEAVHDIPVVVEPQDDHNRELIENVHPPDWHNPEPRSGYHVVVIGAGTGGLVTAAGAATLGAQVALVERHLMGGDCLNYGCVPSKGVIRAARAWHDAAQAAARFGGPRVSGAGDFATAMERMRRLRAGISTVDGARRFSDLGVDVFLGQGRFTAADRLEVGGRELRFRRAVIATGARAAAPPIAGLDAVSYLTNETLFSLTELPKRMVVIGAGPIGCEMAQSFARFGSEVTVLDKAGHVLAREDPDAAEVLQKALVRDGVLLELGAEIIRVERQNGRPVVRWRQGSKEKSAACDRLLVAVGRAPNTESLGLEEAGVSYGRHGVEVDDWLRTSNPRVYAVGDVCSAYKFTHAADAQAKIVIANALFFGRSRVSRLVMPWCTYTSPEVAHVGYYEKDAEAAGYQVETLTLPLKEVDRAVLDGEEVGFLRLHVQKGRGRILGGTIVAEHAGEMVGELSLAVTARVSLAKLGGTIHPYPTQVEMFPKAAALWRRKKLTPTVKKLFEVFFRIFS